MTQDEPIRGITPTGGIVDEVTAAAFADIADGFPFAHRKQLPVAELPADSPESPGVFTPPAAHVWETRDLGFGPVECCTYGDAIRRRDDQHQPCRGPGRIDLRSQR